MKIKLHDISILKRLTLAYILFIFIPSLVFCYFSYQQSRQYIKSQIVNNEQIILNQIDSSIQSKIDLIESVAGYISLNRRLQDFLGVNYKSLLFSLDEYMDNALPLIENARALYKVNLQNITIYMKNEDIPEGYACFYRDTRITDKIWYRQLMESKKGGLWILSTRETFEEAYERYNTPVFTFVQKIVSVKGEYLGVITIDVALKDLFSFIEKIPLEDEKVYVLDPEGHVLFPGRNALLPVEVFRKANSHAMQGNILYMNQDLSPLKAQLVVETLFPQKARSMRTVSITITFFIGMLVVLITLFYMTLGLVFSTINRNIKTMNKVIENGFDTRIPVRRRDEIGQIAEKFNILLEKIQAMVKEMVRKETAHRDAQLEALQYQINPHFIYNTIHIFSEKMETLGHYDLAEAIAYFGKMLRYNISSKTKYATIETEVQNLKSYILLQKLKFKDRILLSMDLPEELSKYRILKFILQPIVENSFNHGIRQDRPLHIAVRFTAIGTSMIRIDIEDDGKGVDAERLELLNRQLEQSQYTFETRAGGQGIGLQNINERLKLFYGKEYGIRLESEKNRYTRVILTIPHSQEQE